MVNARRSAVPMLKMCRHAWRTVECVSLFSEESGRWLRNLKGVSLTRSLSRSFTGKQKLTSADMVNGIDHGCIAFYLSFYLRNVSSEHRRQGGIPP